MDEQPVQLHKETRTPIPATAKHGKRVDYEYERARTACIFMFTEPLAGWHKVTVRQTRTKTDWAIEMDYSKVATHTAQKSRWFTTISIPILKGHFTKPLNPIVNHHLKGHPCLVEPLGKNVPKTRCWSQNATALCSPRQLISVQDQT